jgi:hypothetical protein
MKSAKGFTRLSLYYVISAFDFEIADMECQNLQVALHDANGAPYLYVYASYP